MFAVYYTTNICIIQSDFDDFIDSVKYLQLIF